MDWIVVPEASAQRGHSARSVNLLAAAIKRSIPGVRFAKPGMTSVRNWSTMDENAYDIGSAPSSGGL